MWVARLLKLKFSWCKKISGLEIEEALYVRMTCKLLAMDRVLCWIHLDRFRKHLNFGATIQFEMLTSL